MPPGLRRRAHRRGIGLVEAMISAVILATVLTSALSAIGGYARNVAAQQEQARAQTLASDLLAEIMQAQYTDPDTEVGEIRATWDDIGDYNGHTQSPPTDSAGAALTGFTGWQRSAAVVFVDPVTLAVSASDSGLMRITVTAISPRGATVMATALRSRYGQYGRSIRTATTYLAGVRLNLQVGTNSSTRVISGRNFVNQAP
jgi:Tfp pilus assembly protein PilV